VNERRRRGPVVAQHQVVVAPAVFGKREKKEREGEKKHNAAKLFAYHTVALELRRSQSASGASRARVKEERKKEGGLMARDFLRTLLAPSCPSLHGEGRARKGGERKSKGGTPSRNFSKAAAAIFRIALQEESDALVFHQKRKGGRLKDAQRLSVPGNRDDGQVGESEWGGGGKLKCATLHGPLERRVAE